MENVWNVLLSTVTEALDKESCLSLLLKIIYKNTRNRVNDPLLPIHRRTVEATKTFVTQNPFNVTECSFI